MAEPTSSSPNISQSNTKSSAPADQTQQSTATSTEAPANSGSAIALQQHEEASLDAEINTDVSMNMDGASDSAMPSSQSQQPTQGVQNDSNKSSIPPTQQASRHPTVIEPRTPMKKDASLREFLRKTDDYASLIPDAVTDYYLTLAGLPPPPETDRRLARLLALATQKFVADVAADAYQYSRIRSTNTTSNNPLTGLGGAAGFGVSNAPAGGAGDEGGGAATGGTKAKKDAGKSQPLGGPRAGYGGGGAGTGGQGRTVLTMEDLGMAVGEYGVNVKRGEFYR